MLDAVAEAAGGPWAFALLASILAVAGLVRGFTGFGTGLIFIPVAAALVGPAEAIVITTTTGMATWPLLLPRAWRTAERGDLAILALGALAGAPLGVAVLAWLPEDLVRWLIALGAAATLAALIRGWRYAGRVRRPGLAGVGGAAGVLGGATGLAGPPIVLFYLAGPAGAEVVRANTILLLCVLDIAIVGNLLLRGLVGAEALLLALALAPVYVATTAGGQALFHPDRDRVYRAAAYGVIALAILSGLPLFD